MIIVTLKIERDYILNWAFERGLQGTFTMAVLHSMPQALSPMELACLNKCNSLAPACSALGLEKTCPSDSKVNILHSWEGKHRRARFSQITSNFPNWLSTVLRICVKLGYTSEDRYHKSLHFWNLCGWFESGDTITIHMWNGDLVGLSFPIFGISDLFEGPRHFCSREASSVPIESVPIQFLWSLHQLAWWLLRFHHVKFRTLPQHQYFPATMHLFLGVMDHLPLITQKFVPDLAAFHDFQRVRKSSNSKFQISTKELLDTN